MKEFNEEYLDNIRRIIAEHDDAKARELLDELHPADIAELYNDLDLDQAEYLYKLLGGDKAADVLGHDTQLTGLKTLVHFACTSEDINNLSIARCVKNGIENVWLPGAQAIAM